MTMCCADEVADCAAKLLLKNIAVEISESRATTLRALHAAGVTEMRAAESAVSAAAQEVLDAETLALACQFNAALDAAMEIGARLEALAGRDHLHIPLNVSVPPMAAEVRSALARIPKPNPLDIPINILRFGNGEAHGGERARRHAQLVATEEVSA